MSNLTDALIAAKLVGGSGGSGGGSGLPEITPGSETVVVAERSVSFRKGQGGLYFAELPLVTIASGVTYTVTWDGTTYTCVGSEISMGGQTGIAAGNLSIMGAGEDTGEPFVFAYASSMNGTNVVTTTADLHTIGVTTGTPQTPPDGYVLGVDDGEWKAVPSEGIGLPKITESVVVLDSVLDFESQQGAPTGTWTVQAPLLSTQVGVGDAIIVEWDGTSYNETLYALSGDRLAFGNASILGMGENTGEPFFGMIIPKMGLGVYGTNVSAGEHSIKVVKADDMQLYPDYGLPIIEGGEWVVKSNVITLDNGTSSLLTNASEIRGSSIGTLTTNLDLSLYGVTLPNDVYLPVAAVTFSAPEQEESFTLGISYYHNGTLTVRLKECTNTTYQKNTVALTAVTLLIPQRYKRYTGPGR